MHRLRRQAGELTPDQLQQAVASRVRIDTRSLAVIRIIAGILIIGDVLSRSRHAVVMYTDEAFLPRSLAREFAPEGAISIFWLTGDPWAVAVLFILHALVGLALLLGYHTRLMTVLAFIFVVSLDMRNILVLSHADLLFRLLLLWAIFLPLGERWSIDAVHRERSPRESVAGLASALFLGQMVLMYTMNAIWKLHGDAWISGETPMLVFGLDDITFLLGDHLRAVPDLLAIGGIIWFGLMLASPLLLVVRGRNRALLASLFVMGHLAFAISVRIGAFPFAAMMGLIGFLQPSAWRAIATVADRLGAMDHYERLRAYLAEEGETIPRPTVQSPTIARAIALAYGIALLAVVASFFILGGALAPHAGDLVEPGIDHEAAFEEVLADAPVAEMVYAGQEAIGINQPDWKIFAPHGRTVDRYHVFPAMTVTGDWIDIYNDRPLSFERPYDELQRQYDTYRERFFMNSVARGNEPGLQASLAAYLCAEHDEELVSISFVRVHEEVTRETLDEPGERERGARLIYTHGCGDHAPIEPDIPDL